MNTNCTDRDRIFLDGSSEEWAAFEHHASTCAACAEEIRVWKQLSTAAAEMRDSHESPALWSRIESSLREQQVARAAGKNFWNAFEFLRHISPAWQLALVGAMIIVLAVSAVSIYKRGPVDSGNTLLKTSALADVERTEREYMAAIDKLGAEANPQLNADTPLMVSYREKLLVLDSAIADLQAQAGENPSNAHLRYQLLAMYHEKQQTLQDVLETKR